jgi:hypothetical protein
MSAFWPDPLAIEVPELMTKSPACPYLPPRTFRGLGQMQGKIHRSPVSTGDYSKFQDIILMHSRLFRKVNLPPATLQAQLTNPFS